MKACRIATLLLAAALCGCANLYVRAPWTEPEIRTVYQCSRVAAGLSVVLAYPQMMSDSPGPHGFVWENVFTVPLGCLCLCEAACEAAVDTVLLPFDYFLAKHREGR